jgi:hypothetical protein
MFMDEWPTQVGPLTFLCPVVLFSQMITYDGMELLLEDVPRVHCSVGDTCRRALDHGRKVRATDFPVGKFSAVSISAAKLMLPSSSAVCNRIYLSLLGLFPDSWADLAFLPHGPNADRTGTLSAPF